MSRISERFQTCREAGRAALIPYITGGDPSPQQTVEIMHGLVAGGADIIEIGVPFSDPMADGPVIQAACLRALQAGTSVQDLFAAVREFRRQDTQTPVVFMGYANTLEAIGYKSYVEQAAAAGVDGLLTVDLPPDEAGELTGIAAEAGVELIYLVAPNTSEQRLEYISKAAGGFIYAVALKGVTGAANLDTDLVAGQVAAIRNASQLPVAVGFGVRDPQGAAAVARVADGVVVGSALVQMIADYGTAPDLAQRLQDAAAALRRGMDAATQSGGNA
ncbi:tryptophan synthase subunit alpha [Halorhodospira halochloris]|uniref:Tryptophan synthase alpha chain n=1 Tax=Halorhodospira halochloris TaxID=1052 RepID=A0A0X8X9V9_HALHR|nr:tryptophan synthase subunit alpha [Halorhodospira halochloris]MBK1652318.1 tryptophan synthase subunit alpha [Halorhodospira halochloris]MCG5530108.1 tryptophan synthase subunit alpha [Halorhodospira halochloris]MCG5548431.1 tryptophan synthase subunit alpha [Halorhodospira halochloris]BAU57722.1 tryptophan synthase alpha chain [Halorhodospira halochloris]